MNAKLAQTLARGRAYGFLSLAFAYPEPALLPVLKEAGAGLAAELARLKDDAATEAARRLCPLIAGLTHADWLAAHIECFGHAISKECPPYECEYGQAHIFQKTQRLADLAGFYRAFGLVSAPAAHERVDHIGMELEFMEFLCRKEAYALERRHGAARLAQCRAAQRKFLDEHLGTWAPGFASLLARVGGDGLYAAIAELLAAFLAHELRARKLKPAPLALAPFAEPPAEDCNGCGARLATVALPGG